MNNIILGVCIFLFSASIALSFYAASLLARSIKILSFILRVFDKAKGQYENLRKEGTDNAK